MVLFIFYRSISTNNLTSCEYQGLQPLFIAKLNLTFGALGFGRVSASNFIACSLLRVWLRGPRSRHCDPATQLTLKMRRSLLTNLVDVLEGTAYLGRALTETFKHTDIPFF